MINMIGLERCLFKGGWEGSGVPPNGDLVYRPALQNEATRGGRGLKEIYFRGYVFSE